MSYENAPATKMLATHCVCCARPLVDAESVETGMGPTCRKKHGFTKAQGEADWTAVAQHCPIEMKLGEDERKLCNRLVYTAAVGVRPEVMARIITTIGHLGFTKLAEVLTTKKTAAKLIDQGDRFAIKTPYNPDFVDESRKVPGRWWVGAEKLTTFPKSSEKAMWEMLSRVFPGGMVETETGPIAL